MSATGSHLAAKAKAWGLILGAAATVLGALGGLWQSFHEPKAEAAYSAVRDALKALEAEHEKDHEDLAKLRAFLEGYLRAHELHEEARRREETTPTRRARRSDPRASRTEPRPPAASLPDLPKARAYQQVRLPDEIPAAE